MDGTIQKREAIKDFLCFLIDIYHHLQSILQKKQTKNKTKNILNQIKPLFNY